MEGKSLTKIARFIIASAFISLTLSLIVRAFLPGVYYYNDSIFVGLNFLYSCFRNFFLPIVLIRLLWIVAFKCWHIYLANSYSPEESNFDWTNFDSKNSWEKITTHIITKVFPTSTPVLINGKWGTGKTTFLRYFKSEFLNHSKKNRWHFAHFNAWQLNENNNIIDSFINSLPKHLTLTHRYFKIFAEMLQQSPFYLRWIYATLYGDLNSIIHKIDQSLSDTKSKIIVVVDDLDRCSKEQVESVIKLIATLTHSSNPIQNIQFIVAGYYPTIERQLDRLIGFADTNDEFLEKVFSIQTLPYSSTIVTNYLFSKLEEHENSPKLTEQNKKDIQRVIEVYEKEFGLLNRRVINNLAIEFNNIYQKSSFLEENKYLEQSVPFVFGFLIIAHKHPNVLAFIKTQMPLANQKVKVGEQDEKTYMEMTNFFNEIDEHFKKDGKLKKFLIHMHTNYCSQISIENNYSPVHHLNTTELINSLIKV